LNLDCPAKALEPKVFVPFVNPPGGVPRKIVIERKRRLFEQQNIEELLREQVIDYSKPVTAQNKYENYLPLEIFDDTEFDPRTQQEWMSLGYDEEQDVFKYIPAKGVFFINGRGVWKDCKVMQCNENANKYFVETVSSSDNLNSENSEEMIIRTWIPRIHIMFKAEDPFNFAKRVAHAHKMRKQAESLLVSLILT
jgi:dynein heavy chain